MRKIISAKIFVIVLTTVILLSVLSSSLSTIGFLQASHANDDYDSDITIRKGSSSVHSADTDGDGLSDWQEGLIGSNISDVQDPGLFCLYEEEYRTKDYSTWKSFEDENDTFTIGLGGIVVRRGTKVEVDGWSEGELSIEPTKPDMSSLEVVEDEGWIVDVREDSTVGRYNLTLENEGWTRSMDLYVVFDPFSTGLSPDKTKGYAYDENSNRDEKGYIYTSSNKLYEGELHPFSHEYEDLPELYEFALAGVGNSSTPQEAAVKIVRIVAQRAKAEPLVTREYRDVCSILFYDPDAHVEGLTLEDAEKLAMNDVNIEDLSSPGKTKIVNHWCDETSFSVTALLRSVGIPSRVVSLHPSSDTDIMGHFISEVYFDAPLYHATWDGFEGGWFAFDADEWNAEWWSQDPIFWSPTGECYYSRPNYGKFIELLFIGRYKLSHYYVMDEREYEIDDQPDSHLIEVTDAYRGGGISMNYGSVWKYQGRGGGDLYKVKVNETSRLKIENSGGTRSRIYVNSKEYPALKITYQGYPPKTPNENLSGYEVILEPGVHYIGIYAAESDGYSLTGNYGIYNLTLEKALQIEDGGHEDEIEKDTNYLSVFLNHYLLSVILLAIWIASFAVKRRLDDNEKGGRK